MGEMQITPEQFEVACLEGRQSGPGSAFSFHQGLFQQVDALLCFKHYILNIKQILDMGRK